MYKSVILFIAVVLSSVPVINYAQDNKTRAKEEGKEAVTLEDAGKYDEALPHLKQAEQLDPLNYNYPYEEAYCYNAQKDYPKAIAIMERVITFNGIQAECYQLLGNLYDENGDSAMALKTYETGIKKFPDKAGRLYLETGNIYTIRQLYEKALPYYEKGILIDPSYPSNYYRAAILFLESDEEVWGMLYGELFMNLERNTERTAKISKMLYDTYKSQIVINGDTMHISFTKQGNIINATNMNDPDFKMPFSSFVYEPLMGVGAALDKNMDIESMCNMRQTFLDQYYEKKFNETYPVILFQYQHTIEQAGHLNAYNHWVLMRGDEAGFDKWHHEHEAEWDAFTRWFSDNPIKIDQQTAFERKKMM